MEFYLFLGEVLVAAVFQMKFPLELPILRLVIKEQTGSAMESSLDPDLLNVRERRA